MMISRNTALRKLVKIFWLRSRSYNALIVVKRLWNYFVVPYIGLTFSSLFINISFIIFPPSGSCLTPLSSAKRHSVLLTYYFCLRAPVLLKFTFNPYAKDLLHTRSARFYRVKNAQLLRGSKQEFLWRMVASKYNWLIYWYVVSSMIVSVHKAIKEKLL